MSLPVQYWSGALMAVDANGPSDAWAVGFFDTRSDLAEPLALHWDGQRWSDLSPPSLLPSNAVLTGVAVIGPDDVWTVGRYSYPGGALVEHWDGRAWTDVTSQVPGAPVAIAGRSSSDIWAVGGGTFHWDGHAWSSFYTAGPLTSVAVGADGRAWAVGSGPGASTGPLLEEWDGSTWTVSPAPPGVTASMTGVTVAGSNEAWAVGSTSTGTTYADRESTSVALHWDGSSWTQPAGWSWPYLSWASVAVIASTGTVVTGGTSIRPNVPTVATWSTPGGPVPAPIDAAAEPYPDASFVGVDATSATDVWAVGPVVNFNGFAQHDDGSGFVDVPVPREPNNVALAAVHESAPDDVWAVGTANAGEVGPGGPVIRHFDGTSWHSVTVADPDLRGLTAVDGTAADDVWAVGGGLNGKSAAHWDGTSWSVVAVPTNVGALNGVAAVGSDDVWAVGFNGNPLQPTAAHWDGRTWTPVPVPAAGATGELDGVAAVSAHQLWAVGRTRSQASGPFQPLLERWDGASWSIVDPHVAPAASGQLVGVSGDSANNVWAVGSETLDSGLGLPLALHFDGVAWTQVAAPPGVVNSGFAGVVTRDGNTWAVGGQPDFSADGPSIRGRPLAVTLCPPVPTTAALTHPVLGDVGVDPSVPFTWDAVAGSQAYALAVGTKPYGTDLANSGALPATQTSYKVAALPTGVPLYATLLTERNGAWTFQAVTFRAAPGATLTNPAPGSQTPVDTSKPFTWTAAAGAESYFLAVGTAPFGTDLVNSGVLPATQTSIQVPALPAGRTLYATLLTKVGGVWSRYQTVTFTAAPAPRFTYPTSGQTHVDVTKPFTWSTTPAAQAFIVVIGTARFGGDLFNSGTLAPTKTSVAVPQNLPTGKTLHATLLTQTNGAWTSYDALTFTR